MNPAQDRMRRMSTMVVRYRLHSADLLKSPCHEVHAAHFGGRLNSAGLQSSGELIR